MPIDYPDREGYWYDDRTVKSGLLRRDNFLRYVTPESGWFVVDRDIPSIMLPARSWPGSLWRVRVIELADRSGSMEEPGHWHARTIKLIEELPLSQLFGAHGDALMPLLDQIRALSPQRAMEFLSNQHPGAPAAFTRGWLRWNRRQAQAYPRQHGFDEADGTLTSPSEHDNQLSPIHRGFLLIHDLCWLHARSIEGGAGVERYVDEHGTSGERLAPAWAATRLAYLHAAMALGAPAFFLAGERKVLSYAWNRVFDPYPNLWRKRRPLSTRFVRR